MISERDIGWIAGFLEGEGSFLSVGKNPMKRTLRICAAQVQREPLERLVRLVGGTIYKKPIQNPAWQPCGFWVCHGEAASGWMMTLYPLMSPRRQEQIRKALSTWRLTGPRGALKRFCPQGHEYTPENTDRKMGNHGYMARWCRECRRGASKLSKKNRRKTARWERALAMFA